MENTVIILDCYGIVVTLTDEELHALTPTRYNGGSITSDLHEEEPERKDAHSDEELNKLWNEFNDEMRKIDLYNNAMNGIESMILGHACAGIDITTPAYKEGIESAVQGCANSI